MYMNDEDATDSFPLFYSLSTTKIVDLTSAQFGMC